MKKIVFLSLFALSLPLGMMAQSTNDDLYFVPSKDKEEPAPVKETPKKREATTTIYTAPGTTVVVQDRKGNTRDVDEYNRRYDSRDNEFAMEDDTLYITEKEQPDLDGEWVNGEFEGSQDDYEYAERIIRFRNPRYAISISSPLYWDVVYGANSWDWNVYSDGLYAYAFPTFSNRLWWDWRYNSFGSGFGFGWGSPYYGGYAGYWGGWYGGWGGGWGHHHHHHGYYPGWGGGGGHWANNTTYTNRRSEGVRTVTDRRSGSTSQGRNTSVRRAGTESRTSTGRVVGTRTPSGSVRQGATSRTDASSRRSTYTRPSSTRNSSDYSGTREGVRNSTRTVSPAVTRPSTNSSRSSSYNRGSSTAPSRSTSTESTRRSYDSGNSSSSRSYSPSSSGSSSRSSGTSSGGGSSRSSGGGGSSRSSGSRR